MNGPHGEPDFRILGLMMLALPAFLLIGGCAAKVDVGPYYDAAAAKYDAARTLERRSVDVEVAVRIAEFEAIFAEIDRMTRAQLTQLIVLRWDADTNGFQTGAEEAAWKAFAGVGEDEALPPDFNTTKKPILAGHLSRVFWKNSHDVTGAHILKRGGVARYTGASAPSDPIAMQIEYEAWSRQLETIVYDSMPVIAKIRESRRATVQSLSAQGDRQQERIDATYGALIGMTLGMKQYAETLTDNVQFITLANKVLEAANASLATIHRAAPDPEIRSETGENTNVE